MCVGHQSYMLQKQHETVSKFCFAVYLKNDCRMLALLCQCEQQLAGYL